MRWPWQERETSDFQEEIQAHLAMEEDRLRTAGLSVEEARHEARRTFGNPTRAAEDFADRSLAERFDRVLQELRLALRGLIRQPAFTLPALLTLAMGTGGIAAVLTLAEFALLRPLPYESPERLVRLGEGEPGERLPNIGWQTYDDLRSRLKEFEALAVYRTGDYTLLNGGAPEQLLALQPSSELLPMLGVKALVGRLFSETEDRPQGRRVVLLTHGLWLRRFGADPRIVGQVVALNERPYEVIGVLPPGFDAEFVRDGMRRVELVLPLGYGPGSESACRSCRHLRSIARFGAGATLASAGRDAEAVYAELKNRYPSDYPRRARLELRPLRDVVYGELSRPVLLLLAASGLVLLIACVNVVNLLLVRVNLRGRELAVMAALGAGRSRLMARSALEGLLLSIAGSLLGVGLALWAMPALRWLAPPAIAPLLAMRPDGWVLTVVFGVAALAGLVTGMAPAWQALKVPGVASGVRATEGQAPRIRNALVMGQLAGVYSEAATAVVPAHRN